MLKGISSNTSSKLNNLEGDMKNEICSLLQLYLEVYPLSKSAYATYLSHELDSFIHRLVDILKEDM